MADIAWHENKKSSLPFDAKIYEQSAEIYENGKSIPRREAWLGKM